MGARRPAFALMLVLGATVMVFALAVSGSVALRAATIEASAMRDRAALQRDARSAITLVLSGLTAGAEHGADTISTAGGAGAPAADEASGLDGLDLPPFPSGLPLDLGQPDPPEDGGANGASSSNPGGVATRSRSRGPFTALRSVGLPPEPVEMEIGGESYRVTIEDAQGGVNINRADEQRLADYFQLKGIDQSRSVAIAHQIIDWRDDDDFRRPHGAEHQEYTRRGVRIRNGPFVSVEELLHLPDMSRSIFERVRGDLCVDGDGRTYIGASDEALMATPGMTTTAIRAIRAVRADRWTISGPSLRDALGLAADAAMPNLRTTPSTRLRVTVEPAARPGVRLVGEASVTDRKGIEIGAVRLR